MSLLDLSPPHSIEAEQAVLGGLMLDNDAWDTIADILGAEDFFKREHRLIYQTIAKLALVNGPFDVVTVSDQIPDLAEVGGLSYLGELAKSIPSVANIKPYAEIIRARAHLRRLAQIGFECSRSALEPGAAVTTVQELIEQKLFALGQEHQQAEFVDIGHTLARVVDQIDERFNKGVTLTGIPTGLAELDELTGGLQETDLILLAARPSMGKTAFALNIVQAALTHRLQSSALIFSLEMPADALVYRMLASLGGLDLSRLRAGDLDDEDWPKLTLAVKKLHDFGVRLVIDDSSALTPTALRSRARRAARKYGSPSLIMVDYLQLMRSPGKENRNLEIADISSSLKALAKEFRCPVVALSQLNRELERRANKRPVNGDLRESGSLEQDADLILFIYRDEVYNPDSQDKGIAELIIGKQRNGPLGVARAAFLAQQTRFASLQPASSSQGGRS